jgi:hypothetical protein
LKTFEYKSSVIYGLKLKIIDLSYNKNVNQINNADFNGLTKSMIEVLNISNCNLVKVNSGSLARLFNLKVYSLDNNKNLNYESVKSLLNIWSQKMEYLSLENLNLYNSLDGLINKFSRTLKYLNLAGNNIVLSRNKDFFEKKIQDYKNIEGINLNLNRNFFDGKTSLNLSLNTNLRELHLSSVNLNSIEELLLNDYNIEYLDLSHNNLDEFDFGMFQFLDKLKLSYNKLSNINQLVKSNKLCGDNVSNSSFLDVSFNNHLTLNLSEIECLSKHSKFYFDKINGVNCNKKLLDLMKTMSKLKLDQIDKLKCSSIDLNLYKLLIFSKNNKINNKIDFQNLKVAEFENYLSNCDKCKLHTWS